MNVITIDFNCIRTIMTDCKRETANLIHLDRTTVTDKSRFFKRLEIAFSLYQDRFQLLKNYLESSKTDYKEPRAMDALRALSRLRLTIDSFVSLYEYTTISQLFPVDNVAGILSATDDELVELLLTKKKQLHVLEYVIYLTWILDSAAPRVDYIVRTEKSAAIFDL